MASHGNADTPVRSPQETYFNEEDYKSDEASTTSLQANSEEVPSTPAPQCHLDINKASTGFDPKECSLFSQESTSDFLVDTTNVLQEPTVSLSSIPENMDLESVESVGSGASDGLPAPAAVVCALGGKEDIVPPSTSIALTDESGPFQPECNSLMDIADQAGSASCKSSLILPLQDPSKSKFSFPDLYNQKKEKKSLQFSEENNFGLEKLTEKPLISKSSVFQAYEDRKILEAVRKEKKMLYSFFDENSTNKPVNTDFQEDNVTEHTFLELAETNSNSISNNGDQVSDSLRKRQNSYANKLAPPNARPAISGAAPDCGILIERIEGWALDVYAWGVSDVIGKGAISFIGRDPRDDTFILIFVKSPEMAEELVQKGVWIRNRWLNVSFFQKPALKLIISGVMPFIPDTLIIEACESFGVSVYPALRKIPAAVRSQAFIGAFSYRREMYLIKNNSDAEIPEKLEILFLGVSYILDISMHGVRCFTCGALYHISKNCKANIMKRGKDEELNQTPSHSNDTTKTTTAMNHLTQLSNPNVICKENSQLSNVNETTNSKKESSTLQQPPKACRSFWSQCDLLNLPTLEKLPVKDLSTQIGEHSIANLIETKSPGQRQNEKDVQNTGTKKKEEQKGKNKFIEMITTDATLLFKRPMNNTITNGDTISSEDNSSNEFKESKKKKKKAKLQYQESLSGDLEGTFLTAAGFVAVPSQVTARKETKSMMNKYNDSEGRYNSNMLEFTENSTDGFNFNPIKKTGESDMAIKKQKLKEVSRIENKLDDGFDWKLQTSEGKAVLEDWCKRSSGLKFGPRRKLAAQFQLTHPNLEKTILSVLEIPENFVVGSLKYKKVKELLTLLKQLEEENRKNSSHRKRR